MVKEYSVDEVLSFPQPLYTKYLDGYYVVISIMTANWLILNKDEYRMFSVLRNGSTIRKALESYYKEIINDEKVCLNVMTSLLSQIDETDFYSNAKVMDEEPIQSIPKNVHIGITNGCNLRCMHCYMAAGLSPLRTIDVKKVMEIIQELNKTYGKLEIVISGGEPLTYKGIEVLLNELYGNHIILFTNGVLINEENIDIISKYCDEIQISFEGVSCEAYEQVRGKGNYAKVLKAIELLKYNMKKIILAITILPNTLEDIKRNLIDFVKSINYDNLEIRLSDDIEISGNATGMDFSKWSKKESQELVINLIRQLRELGCLFSCKEKRNVKMTNCGIGASIVINYDGKIYPCNKVSNYALDETEKPMEIIEKFNHINESTSNTHIHQCQKCELRYICSGGCRIDNFIKTGDMTKVICDQEFKDNKIRKMINTFKAYHNTVK